MSLHSRRGFLRLTGAAAAASLAWPQKRVLSAEGGPRPFRPRLAICNETFEDWPLEKAFGFSAECGYQGVEIAPFTIAENVRDISAARRQEVRRAAEKAGLEVIGLHWLLAKTKGLHLTSPDADVRRKTGDYLADLARFCADLGGKLLVFGSPQQRNLLPGVTREEAMKRAAEVFRGLLPVLEKTDTLLALEPLSPETTTFLTTAAEGVELVKMVDSPLCRLHLDCRAMSSEPTPIPDLLRAHRAWLVHLHANDPNSQGPGFGKLDFVPIFQALAEIGYTGWVSVEVFDYAPGPERLARESIRYMRECLAKVRA